MRSPRPRPSRVLRETLFARAGGRCERCGVEITPETFHVAHLRAHHNGGSLVEENTAAWCMRCNLTQGPHDVEDTRLMPRPWQWLALPQIVERIRRAQVATVAAAPGAGKTIFASLVFEALRDSGHVDRMVVLAPRRTLVQQWHDSLRRARHVELRPNGEVERRGQEGVVVTYQSLSVESVGLHGKQLDNSRTLFVLDEVHHVGEPNDSGGRPAWARHVTDLVGDVEKEIFAAGVLNLSGTLWRSKTSERISTVRYSQDGDGKLVSDVDFEITAAELIRDGQLRPVDLFRQGATVELVKLSEGQRLVSKIADLDESAAGRAAIRELPSDEQWRERFVDAVLDRLEGRHRDLNNGPAKALIVARSQDDARAFRETTDRLMQRKGLRPISMLAVSDEKDAQETLEKFRKLNRSAVLCTVDMAGEGYDCPDIAVVGFATNKLTPLYVRQVVARAQRVTPYEREELKRPIPAAVVIPDVPQLVAVMSSILEPMRHELRDPVEDEAGAPEAGEQATLGGLDTIFGPKFALHGVEDYVEGDARVTGELDGDVEMSLVRLVEPEARRVGLPESDAPRMIVAVRTAISSRQEDRPFDPLPGDQAELATALAEPPPSSSAPRTEPLSVEEHAKALQAQLAALGRWWRINGDTPIAIFNAEVNQAGRIPKGNRPGADVEKLERALKYARQAVGAYCKRTGKTRPRASNPPLGDQ